MQLHSSLVPVALPVSLAASLGTVLALHALGASLPQALTIATWVGGVLNVAIGLPKNLVMGDVLSVLLVRPLSLWGMLAALAAIGPHL